MARPRLRYSLGLLLLAFTLLGSHAGDEKPAGDRTSPWVRHVIDDSSKGADGVRAADVNGDGLMDLVTGWEQGGIVRAYLNPGAAKAKEKWPAVTVGKVGSPEDAVFVDVDGDGAVDVVSCCEGGTKSVFVHWAPKDKADYLNDKSWKTEAIPAVKGVAMWMFCLPIQVDGKHGIDLVIGGKGDGAKIGWLEAPAKPRDLSEWKWHPLYDAGWIMSLVSADIDGDGDQDILTSDRRGKNRGCLWLENPGPGEAQTQPWKSHIIGATRDEVMFLDLADLDGDGKLDVLVPTFNQKLHFLRHKADKPPTWESIALPFPDRVGSGKAVRVADLDGDGKSDVIITGGDGGGPNSGVVWMTSKKAATEGDWQTHDISGPVMPKGMKPDLIQLLDLDGDGDLDVITSEERSGLGVIWFENPTKR